MLSDAELARFVEDGFVLVESAFPNDLAERCRSLLWEETGCQPDDPATWTEPVIRITGRDDPPFQAAATTDRLHACFDQLVGAGRWEPRRGLGTFPIRFPHPDPPRDDGWHVDAGWHVAEDEPGFHRNNDADLPFEGYRINRASRGRALLMLFLFSDVAPNDAPTRIRIGSHRRVARFLEPRGPAGISGLELPSTADLAEVEATGRAGDVYLCHPFLVHAAQRHRGTRPKFMAQPPLSPTGGQLDLDRVDTPVVPAIVHAT